MGICAATNASAQDGPDPCAGSSDPCCGNPDPCCGSTDPCCGVNCGTCSSCSGGTCVPNCPPAGGCPAGQSCQTPPSGGCPTCMGTCWTLQIIPPKHASCDCVAGSGCGTAQYDIAEQRTCVYGATSGGSSCSPNVVNLGYFYPCSDTVDADAVLLCEGIWTGCAISCIDPLNPGCIGCIIAAASAYNKTCGTCALHVCKTLLGQGNPHMGHQDSVSGSCP